MIRVAFKQVSKSYTLINTGGIKTFLFNIFTQVKDYQKKRFSALQDVSFTIYDKEVVGIIGRNGAGKSTTLGLMAGVLAPTSGEVFVQGRIAPLLELGAGFHHDLTGRENIKLNALLLGLTKRQVDERLDDIIAFSELDAFIDQPIRMYSSGMLARLGFSIAVHTEPEILLIDEVLSVGDQQFQAKSAKKIHEFKEKGITIIFVSHDVHAVETICDKVIWIENHQVKMIGNATEVVKEYRCVHES
jgi:lipopolysaccharide transport system ATP-binding protein